LVLLVHIFGEIVARDQQRIMNSELCYENISIKHYYIIISLNIIIHKYIVNKNPIKLRKNLAKFDKIRENLLKNSRKPSIKAVQECPPL